MEMEDRKLYLQPKEMVYHTLLDLTELQKGEIAFSDPLYGKLQFRMTMYGFLWRLRFTVLGMDWNRCAVSMEIAEGAAGDEDAGEEKRRLKDMISREWALLDSLLLIGTPFEAVCGQER